MKENCNLDILLIANSFLVKLLAQLRKISEVVSKTEKVCEGSALVISC